MEDFIKEKEIVLSQTRSYLMALADTGAPPVLMLAILNIRDRAATANKSEWKKEGYYQWWLDTRPEYLKTQ